MLNCLYTGTRLHLYRQFNTPRSIPGSTHAQPHPCHTHVREREPEQRRGERWGGLSVQSVGDCRGAASSHVSGDPTIALLLSLAMMEVATINQSVATTCQDLEG